MARVRAAGLLLVCVLAASCLHTADAFWGRSRRVAEQKPKEEIPAPDDHDEHDSHVDLDAVDLSAFHDPSQPPPFPEVIPDDAHSNPHYWYNEWTQEVSWHEPSYEHHDGGWGVAAGFGSLAGLGGEPGEATAVLRSSCPACSRETGLGWTCSTRTPTMGFHAACSCLHNEPALPKRPRPRPCRPPAEHGRLYYSNPDTRVSSWDKPDSLEWEEHLDGDSVPCVGAACFPGVGPHLGRGVGRVNCAACQQM